MLIHCNKYEQIYVNSLITYYLFVMSDLVLIVANELPLQRALWNAKRFNTQFICTIIYRLSSK